MDLRKCHETRGLRDINLVHICLDCDLWRSCLVIGGGGGKLLHILKLIITHNDVLKNEADTGTNDDLEAYEFPIVWELV